MNDGLNAPPTGDFYDADYFLNGKDSGKSLYKDYRWLPELTVPMAQTIVRHLGVRPGESILDYGCARGYTVKALRSLGYPAEGIDISAWAIENCDLEVKEHVKVGGFPTVIYDWIIAKDVLEHVPLTDIENVTRNLMGRVTEGVFVVVPLSRSPQAPYVCAEYERDQSHHIRWPIHEWVALFERHTQSLENAGMFSIEASLRIPGVKDNYAQYPDANGFLTLRRI